MDDLDAIIFMKPVFGVDTARHDHLIGLHRNPSPGQAQIRDQLCRRTLRCHFAPLTIDIDIHLYRVSARQAGRQFRTIPKPMRKPRDEDFPAQVLVYY